jgi:hypothetical protein
MVLTWGLMACGGTSSNGSQASSGSATAGGAGSSGGGESTAAGGGASSSSGGKGTVAGGSSSSSAGKDFGAGGEGGEGGEGGASHPPSQGAFTLTLKSVSPAPAGKACPAGAAASFAIPQVDQPNELLSNTTYLHWVVDGEAGAKVSCKVAASGGFSFEGAVQQAGRALQISQGTLGADHQGTARITVANSQLLSSALSSPMAMDCTVSAAKMGFDNFQVQPGAMWASFVCAAVVAEPSDYCTASGIFVLENCEQ